MTTYKQFATKHDVKLAEQFLRCETTDFEHLVFRVVLYRGEHDPKAVLLGTLYGARAPVAMESTYKMGMAAALPEKWVGGKRQPRLPDPAKRPKVEDVLQALATDATAINSSFEEWCADLGYDTDSRKAYSMFEACRGTFHMLNQFLGLVAVHELLECEEG